MLADARMFDVLTVDLDRLDAVGTRLDAPVPACPGWTVIDVLGHVGRVHRRIVGLLVGGEPFTMLADRPPPPPPDEVVAWRRVVSREMVAALQATDLDHPKMTWFGEATARVWLRRMMHETAIHRWDVQAAIGPAAPLDPDVAVDAIDEWLEVFVAGIAPTAWSAVAPSGATLRAHPTDAPQEWRLRFGPSGLEVTGEDVEADVALRGSASELTLVLWGRLPPAVVEVTGDRALLDRFLETATF